MKISALRDMMQSEKKLEIPEIRVWCHPHKIEKSGDDYYETFPSFAEALEFIKVNKVAEEQPLIAFRGWELNIFKIPEATGNDKKDRKILKG